MIVQHEPVWVLWRIDRQTFSITLRYTDEKAVDRVKGLGCLEKEPPEYFISPSEVSKKLVFYCGGRNK